jgi:hypothetical protein
VTSDDRRLLDRDADATQPPAPVARPTPPEELRSRTWVEVKRTKWMLDLARSPREVVARALYQIDEDPPLEAITDDDDQPFKLWSQLEDVHREPYLRLADAALDAVAPLLRSPTFRSIEARRNAELRNALSLVEQLHGQVDDLIVYQLGLEAKLQRYREAVRALARIVQRKRAGANRQVAYYKRLYLNTMELLRRRQS